MNFEEVCRSIREVRIQGATNVAKAATNALLMKHDAASVKKLIGLRPTEPTLRNSLAFALSFKEITEGVGAALNYFDKSEKEISKLGASKIKNGMNVFVHCHSNTLMSVLKEAKWQGKKFTVHNTETRPLYQGRITARELSAVGIPVIHYVDSAARIAMKKCDLALFGADAITPTKIYNKVGSEMFAIIAMEQKVPLYICSDAWKFSRNEEVIEERSPDEVWHNPPEKVRIENPAFERIAPELVTGIISELGILSHKDFLKKVKVIYPFI